ncbi:MAG: DUF4350 domain-containing protein [Anaeromyxobacteraceae bacterium]
MRRGLAAAGIVAALALVLAGTVVGQRRQAAAALDPLPSAENTGPAGLAAARAFLLGRGVAAPVVRPGDAPPPPGEGVVVVAAPAASLDVREADALLEHAARGGTLVLAAGRAPQPALEARLGVRFAPAPGARMAVPLAPHPLVEGLVLPVGEGQLLVTGGDALPIAGVRDAVAAAALRVGRGEVVLLAGPEPLTNARLAQGGALSLLIRLAARGPVALDERWLEARTGARAPPAALGALAGQALLAFGAYALARGRRLGAIRPPPADGRGRTARDYLRALAGLYRRAAAEGELARAAWARARRELERRAGIPARLPDADAALRLEARSPAAAAAFERGRTALARQPGPDALLAVVRACADLDDALRGK